MKQQGAFNTDPYWRVVTSEGQKTLVSEMIDAGKTHAPGVAVNQMVVKQINPDGGLNYMAYPEAGVLGPRPIIKEMIDTTQGAMALLDKVEIDVAFGLAETPLLYQPIYRNVTRRFPGGMYKINDYTIQAVGVFLQKFEGGEVEFGTLQKGVPAMGTIQTYALGFEWTEDAVEYDDTWSIEDTTKEFGRSYNRFLNHLHLSPIIGYSYPDANTTDFNNSGSSHIENIHLTLQDAYKASVTANPRRPGTILLASEADRFDIESAVLTPVFDDSGNALPNIPIDTIIYYDGDSVQMGDIEYVYPGVTPGSCFLIFPQKKMVELVHHDLRIDIGPADISRLVEGQQVGRTRRSVFAGIEESVQYVNIAST